MSSVRRLPWLLLLLVGVLLVRFWVPPERVTSPPLAEPVARAIVAGSAAATADEAARRVVTSTDTRDEADEPRELFAVRVRPAPRQAAPAPIKVVPSTSAIAAQAPAQAAVAVPSSPVAAVQAPMVVVGTWDDGGGLSAFVSAQNKTVHARPGDMPVADYRVDAITAQQLTVTQLSTQQVLLIPIQQPGANLAMRP